MKVFQLLHRYDAYIPFFEAKYNVDDLSYEEHRQTLIKDRFYALHLLKPVLELKDNAFYTLWNYEKLQLKWAQEKGWNETDLKKIILAQIEDFKPDVLYNAALPAFDQNELQNKIDPRILKVCWSASPYEDKALFQHYATRLTNFLPDLLSKSDCGYRNDLFSPAYDPVMEEYASNQDRPIDLFFYGQYADDAFKQRNFYLDKLLEFQEKEKDLNIKLCLQYRIRKEIVVNIPYVRRYLQRVVFPSKYIRNNASAPVYGLNLYENMSKSKIVFNAGVDYTGEHKVNMRCFEALGCGAHMISDVGIYPKGFEMNKHFSTYSNIEECLEKVKALLKDDTLRTEVAQAGHTFIKEKYNKTQQWQAFQKIIASI